METLIEYFKLKRDIVLIEFSAFKSSNYSRNCGY